MPGACETSTGSDLDARQSAGLSELPFGLGYWDGTDWPGGGGQGCPRPGRGHEFGSIGLELVCGSRGRGLDRSNPGKEYWCSAPLPKLRLFFSRGATLVSSLVRRSESV